MVLKVLTPSACVRRKPSPWTSSIPCWLPRGSLWFSLADAAFNSLASFPTRGSGLEFTMVEPESQVDADARRPNHEDEL